MCTGDFTLSTQTQVDAFNCATVTGNLSVQYDENVQSDYVTSIAGLSELTSVGGTLRIFGTLITSVEGLSNLVSVGGTLEIDSNGSFTDSYEGLRNLQTVGGLLDLDDNGGITTLSGLRSLRSAGGLYIANSDITSLEGLEGVTSVPGRVTIFANSFLASLEGLRNLQSVGGDVDLDRNRSLVSLSGLEQLTSVGGLSVFDNEALVSLSGLKQLTSVGGLRVSSNEALVSCAGDLSEFISGSPPAFTGVSGTVEFFANAPTGRCNSEADVLAEYADLFDVPPGFAKGFAPDAIRVGETSRLTFTIDNSAETATVSSLSFTDDMPAGMVVAPSHNASSTCGGTVAATTGSGSISLGGGSAGPGSMCTVAVDVTGTTVGVKTNITSALNFTLGSTGQVGGATDVLTVNAPAPPVVTSVSATPNPATVGEPVTITAAFTDPYAGDTNGCAITYGDGSGATGSVNGLTCTDTYTYPAPGVYTVTVTVTDGFGGRDSGTSSVTVVPANAPPVADAGADQTVEATGPDGADVALDGSNSSDTDGDALAYSWAENAIEVATGATPTVALGFGDHTLTLTVSDPSGETDSDDVVITVVDTTSPVITLVGDAVVTLECGADYFELGANASDLVDGDVPVIITGTVDAGAPGDYVIRYNATDATGNAAVEATRTVRVVDTTAPVLSVGAAPLVLWPPDHTYHTVSLSDLGLAATDVCDTGIAATSAVVTEASSDEVENGDDDGDTTDDIVIDDCSTVQLRAERQGVDDGRVYTLALAVADASGNTGGAAYEVHVPVSRKETAMGGSAVYSVEGCEAAPSAAAREASALEVSVDSLATALEVSADSSAATAASGWETAAAASKGETPGVAAMGTEGGMPVEFALEAAYPNPFRSSATLTLAVPESSVARVVVYDALGRTAAVLLDGPVEAGRYPMRFDASGLPSGTYLVRLTTESGFNQTRRLTLVR